MEFDLRGVQIETPPQPEKTKETAEMQEVSVEAPSLREQQAVEYAPRPQTLQREVEVPVRTEEEGVRLEKDPLLEEVENILADKTIMGIYHNLPESKKLSFKESGERLAREIRDALAVHKVRPHRILNGIRKWLASIPDVNKYYLLQEAKIDLDKVLALSEDSSVNSENAL